jgi:hypothetical protein
MAPTDVKFPVSPSGEIIPYNYSIDYSPMKGVDVLGEFIKSCEKKQIKTGFYYSVVTNNWFNVEGGQVNSIFFQWFLFCIIGNLDSTTSITTGSN